MSTAAVPRRAKNQSRHASILIVGGSARVRNAHAIELGTNGYDVECADSVETAIATYRAKPTALVLFAMDENSGKAWDVYRLIASDHPEQAMGFALSSEQKLCSVSFGGAEVIRAQGPDDLLSMVEGLIGGPNGDAGRHLELARPGQQPEPAL